MPVIASYVTKKNPATSTMLIVLIQNGQRVATHSASSTAISEAVPA